MALATFRVAGALSQNEEFWRVNLEYFRVMRVLLNGCKWDAICVSAPNLCSRRAEIFEDSIMLLKAWMGKFDAIADLAKSKNC